MPDPLGGWDYTWPLYLAAFLGYLLGSIPFGYVLTRAAGGVDLRKAGSGSTGATNVLRTGKKGLALATLLLDGGKGALAVYLGARYGPDTQVIAAGGAVIGHIYPVWLRFHGGKGVATTLGVILAISWPVGLAACLVWLVVALITRYSSLSSILAMLSAPLFLWLMLKFQREGMLSPDLPGLPQHVDLLVVLAIVVIVKHHANLQRLANGSESKIRLKRRSETAP
ncbi:MAG: acyl-phosphate glycerol 3-phosphate acyltransferase [Rhodospirillaceae bacterium]|jgi:glycerol-3-phosphate acyltransferase PlsY|nr:acyl-phosphate glycerol 3-phosphate acyltransferase [Rhodospirillaceae bacterium]|tara:strand:- start:972 stop:1646 length:675 start_codon:yes stop_codon:yes gene_type:complete